MTYILIQAGEGNTQAIFVASGANLLPLRALVAETLARDIAAFPLPWSDGNQGHMERVRQGLLSMLDAAGCLIPGRYVVQNVEPPWEEWTLVIVDGAAAFLDDRF